MTLSLTIIITSLIDHLHRVDELPYEGQCPHDVEADHLLPAVVVSVTESLYVETASTMNHKIGNTISIDNLQRESLTFRFILHLSHHLLHSGDHTAPVAHVALLPLGLAAPGPDLHGEALQLVPRPGHQHHPDPLPSQLQSHGPPNALTSPRHQSQTLHVWSDNLAYLLLTIKVL